MSLLAAWLVWSVLAGGLLLYARRLWWVYGPLRHVVGPKLSMPLLGSIWEVAFTGPWEEIFQRGLALIKRYHSTKSKVPGLDHKGATNEYLFSIPALRPNSVGQLFTLQLFFFLCVRIRGFRAATPIWMVLGVAPSISVSTRRCRGTAAVVSERA